MTKKRPDLRKKLRALIAKAPYQKWAPLLFLSGVLLAVALTNIIKESPEKSSPPEALTFANQSPTFSEVRDYLTALAQKKGALYAYQTLRVMELPPNMDFHLLGHLVSDQIYKEKGINGMSHCTDDFRNACSHAIVVGIFSEQGIEALPKITEACRKAPGGSGAYSMCFHGLGHGILSYFGYQMEKAVPICTKAGINPFPNQEATQCISGAVMEIITGGDHDREVWTKQHRHYLTDNPNPLSLCQSSYMPAEAAPLCFTYLTPYLFIAAGTNLGKPDPAYFKKALSFCETIPPTQRANREACFGGFGKEFVVLVRQRDIRNMEQISDTELDQAYKWCQLAGNQEGVIACITHSISSLYWGGENDVSGALRYCGIIGDETQKSSCYRNLTSMVYYFQKSSTARESFCRKLPDLYRINCGKV